MQQADQTVAACRDDIILSFVMSAQDDAKTLAVILTALTKLTEPGSAAHDLATLALAVANTIATEADDAADSLH